MPTATITRFPAKYHPRNSTPLPLPCDQLVTDDMLRTLARHDAERDRGEFSDELRAMLAMVLPEICGELLALRALHRRGELGPVA